MLQGSGKDLRRSTEAESCQRHRRHAATVTVVPSSLLYCSIALGAVELSLTPKDASKQKWPADLPGTVNQLAAAFEAYVGELAGSGMLQAEAAPAAKVKAVADAVWSKLNKGYSKDLQHAQVGSCAFVMLFCQCFTACRAPPDKRQCLRHQANPPPCAAPG